MVEVTSSRSEELWWLALTVSSVAVVVIAVLFGLVIATLQSIDRHAARTHTASKQIAQNTVALWTLEQTNRDLVAIRDAARGAETARLGTGLPAPVSALADKVQDWLGRSDEDDDKSS
jgi:type II secretory pathway component PulJ